MSENPNLTGENELEEDLPVQHEQKNFNFWWIILIVCAVLACILIGALIFVNMGSSEPPPPTVEDNSWQRVKDAGVLRVATSADYPPFSFYNDDYQIDGFDAALIKEIGLNLGVSVKISDYAFQGLGSVLQVDQADVVIAAISVTSEREQTVDFSNVYYVGEDGILAQVDSEIDNISNPGQMAGMRIGVQKLSIYQDWVQENLVDTGLIGEGDLFTYAKPEHAVDDLRQNRLDLVIMDLQPATVALSLGDLELVGSGLNQLQLAIALPKGTHALRTEINQAILDLQNSGKITELAGIYLGLRPEDVIPPPTPLPTPEATATATVTPEATVEPTEAPCVDAMEFIEDLNYDDEDLTDFPKVDPGEEFQKGWRIKNSGTCLWNSSYFIKYVRGSDPAAQMQGQPTSIKGAVEPGETYDMYVDLVAPEVAGKYVGNWQMHNGQNEAFGQTIWVAIRVRKTDPEAPTATITPKVTATPPTVEPTETEEPPAPTETELPPEPTPTEKPGSELQDITWVVIGYLAEIEDDDLTEPIPDTKIELVFDDDDRYNGNAGCNTYNGTYTTDGIAITFTPRVVTKIQCEEPEGLMEQETHYLGLLDEVEEYRINEDGQLELIFYITNENNEREEKILLVFDGLQAVPPSNNN